MKFRPMLLGWCAACVALGISALVCAQTAPIKELATFAQSSVDVGSGAHRQHFDVWIAASPEQQSQGLMFVRDLPAGRGMLSPSLNRARPHSG